GSGDIGVANSDKKKQIRYTGYHGGGHGPTSQSFGTGNYDYGAIYTVNDVISVALDLSNNTIIFYKNGVSQGVSKYTPSLLGDTV
ncbi:hypothetical protein H6F38_34045, partial [Paenibacillus sp. EKM208P]